MPSGLLKSRLTLFGKLNSIYNRGNLNTIRINGNSFGAQKISNVTLHDYRINKEVLKFLINID